MSMMKNDNGYLLISLFLAALLFLGGRYPGLKSWRRFALYVYGSVAAGLVILAVTLVSWKFYAQSDMVFMITARLHRVIFLIPAAYFVAATGRYGFFRKECLLCLAGMYSDIWLILPMLANQHQHGPLRTLLILLTVFTMMICTFRCYTAKYVLPNEP